jgi:hypothetical protein
LLFDGPIPDHVIDQCGCVQSNGTKMTVGRISNHLAPIGNVAVIDARYVAPKRS